MVNYYYLKRPFALPRHRNWASVSSAQAAAKEHASSDMLRPRISIFYLTALTLRWI